MFPPEKVLDYVLVLRNHDKHFREAILQLLDLGYQPYGSPSFLVDAHGKLVFIQALVKMGISEQARQMAADTVSALPRTKHILAEIERAAMAGKFELQLDSYKHNPDHEIALYLRTLGFNAGYQVISNGIFSERVIFKVTWN